MAPRVPSAKTTLSYPLFSVDFDPQDNRFLLVGGGGGESHSGVGNKLTLLNTSRQFEISELGDVELSREEDSVTSLAVARRISAQSVLAFAGINSSSSLQEKGKNEHLRSFAIKYGAKPLTPTPDWDPDAEENDEDIEISELSRASLFTPSSAPQKETYQRVLRLSPLRSRDNAASRLAAVATGLAAEGEAEIVVFDTKLPAITNRSVRARIDLGDQEAADVDIIETGQDEFSLVYCIDFELYHCRIDEGPDPSKHLVYGIPFPDTFAYEHSRPQLRALRFLTPQYVVALQNLPHRKGAELLIIKLGNGLGEIVRRKRMHRSMKAAVSLDVAVLDDNKGLEKQIVIAVAGQDISIALFSLKFTTKRGVGKFKSYAVLRNVHPVQITKVCFSNFIPPVHPINSSTLPQYLKLASVSMGNTVVVHTFPLVPLPFRSKTPHYVLSFPSQTSKTVFAVIAALLSTIFSAFLFHFFLEIRGGTPPYFGAVQYLHPKVSSFMARPYILDPSDTVTTATVTVGEEFVEGTPATLKPVEQRASVPEKPDVEKLQELRKNLGENMAFVLAHGEEGVKADLQPDEAAQDKGKPWKDLGEEQRAKWRKRLGGAEEWFVGAGTTMLEGIFFAELGAHV